MGVAKGALDLASFLPFLANHTNEGVLLVSVREGDIVRYGVQ